MKTLLLACLIASNVPAQVFSMNFFRPKRDRFEEFEAAIKDYNVATAKNGWTGTIIGFVSPGRNEYMFLSPLPNWAAFQSGFPSANHEHDAERTHADFRIREANDSARNVLAQVVPELSLPMPAEMPKILDMAWIKIRREKSADYEAAVATILPTARKSMKLYILARVIFGEVQQYLLLTGLNEWSDLDKPDPMVQAMGADAWRAFRARIDPLVIERRGDIYRYAPELTYKPK